MNEQISHVVKVSADIGVYGVVLIGWLGLIQPWLTAIATVTAIVWTTIQIYEYYKNKKNSSKRTTRN